MRRIVATGRRKGQSSMINDIQSIIIAQQSREMQKSIDKMILDELWMVNHYNLKKSWCDRRGRKMHRVGCSKEVMDWLEENHSQYGVANPEWWKFERCINITDKLFVLLTLRWAE